MKQQTSEKKELFLVEYYIDRRVSVMDSPDFDVPDPATGLSPREKKALIDTWELVKLDITGNGVAILVEFFRTYPQKLEKFAAFSTVPLDKLSTNKKFHAHANAIMYTVTSVVDNLDEPEVLVEMLKKLGENHGRRKIVKSEFEELKKVILIVLTEKLGNKLTPQAAAAWDKALTVVVEVTSQGINSYTQAHSSIIS
uniref:Globin domain-containing protein n=1 Tax=Timema bartmani TaxID=61472 RepID=A0A7R9F2C9_9NEOP|nr:unnamed protein product [Timema bartmani]